MMSGITESYKGIGDHSMPSMGFGSDPKERERERERESRPKLNENMVSQLQGTRARIHEISHIQNNGI
jgi:hypothetical protein